MRPDRNAIVVLLFLLVVSLLAISTGGIVFYIVSIAAVLVLALDCLWLMRSIRDVRQNLSVSRHFTHPDIFLNTTTDFITVYEYRGRMVHSLVLRQEYPVHMEAPGAGESTIKLSPSSRHEQATVLKPLKHGNFMVGPVEGTLASMFFRHALELGEEKPLKVHISISSSYSRSTRQNIINRRVQDDLDISAIDRNRGEMFSKVRKYLVGDDVRRIDWPRSLQADDLIIREFEEERSIPVIFLIDTDASMGTGRDRTELESAVDIVVFMINRFLVNRERIGLATFTRNATVDFIPLGMDRGHIQNISNRLSDLKPAEGDICPVQLKSMSIAEGKRQARSLKEIEGMEQIGELFGESLDHYLLNGQVDGFCSSIMKASMFANTPSRIFVLTNLSMGLTSLMNGIRVAKYYGHSVTIVFTPHIWYEEKELIDIERYYEKYQEIKNVISKLKGSGRIKVIDLYQVQKAEETIYRGKGHTTGIRR
mgnify:CR=1 FL=1